MSVWRRAERRETRRRWPSSNHMDDDYGSLKMVDEPVIDNVIGMDRLPALRADLSRFEAQRTCMRISDRNWHAMKRRARRSNRPITEALQSELSRYAKYIQSHF
jgi:hypothetical protein